MIHISKLCFDCYNVGFKIKEKKEVCKKCGGYNLINIDDLLIESIINFNKKGYKTLYSCQGHLENKNLYIRFDKLPSNVPKNLRIDTYNTIRYHFSELNNRDFFLEQLDIINIITEWSEEIDEK